MKTFSADRLIKTFCVVVVALLVMAGNARALDSHNNIGIGFGIPFSGVLGLSYEYEVDAADSFSFGPTLALGHTILADIGWNVGLQTHFLSVDSVFRPGLSVWYGTNLIIEKRTLIGTDDWESKKGVTIGASGRFQFGDERHHAIDLYVLYPFMDDIDKTKYEEQGTDVKAAIGYIYRF